MKKLILLFTALAGCIGQETIHVGVAQGSDPAGITTVEQAVAAWQCSPDRIVSVGFSDGADVIVSFVAGDVSCGKHGDALGCTNLDNGTVVVNPEYFGVLVHEIGHVMLLPHSQDVHSVMFPTYLSVDLPTDADRKLAGCL